MTSTWQKEKNNSDSKSPTCHSAPSFCHSKFPPCHSEPLGEESKESKLSKATKDLKSHSIRYFANAQYDKVESPKGKQ